MASWKIVLKDPSCGMVSISEGLQFEIMYAILGLSLGKIGFGDDEKKEMIEGNVMTWIDVDRRDEF